MSYTAPVWLVRTTHTNKNKQGRKQSTVMAKNGNPGSGGAVKEKGPSTRWQIGAPSRGPGKKPNVLREQRRFSEPRVRSTHDTGVKFKDVNFIPTARSLKNAFRITLGIPGSF